MPKFELFISPGEELPAKLNSILQDYFSKKDFEKLSKFGGRIQISLTAPFTDRKLQNDNLDVDDNFVALLKSDLGNAPEMLKTLTKKQLEKVAERLNFPTTSKSTTKETKNAILSYLNSGDKWEKISGSK